MKRMRAPYVIYVKLERCNHNYLLLLLDVDTIIIHHHFEENSIYNAQVALSQDCRYVY